MEVTYMSSNEKLFKLSETQRGELASLAHRPTTAQRLAMRASIILAAEGRSFKAAAAEQHCAWRTVGKWCRRYLQYGLDGLNDKRRSGRSQQISADIKAKIISLPAADHFMNSCRKVAALMGVSRNTVNRIWRFNGIKPHLTRGFNLSNDPHFEEKFWDVVGLYLDPPEKAIVLCCDEKTQIQALERTQPCLPLGIGHVRTATHDYYRHGTTTLFAALNYLDGKVISRLDKRHTNEEWLSFLKKINRETPRSQELHLIVDNYSTHKHASVKEWLEKHPRFHIHFTPTGSSWMNLVERFFRDITMHLRTESFPSLAALTKSIMDFLAAHNEMPHRYVWHKSGQEILEKIQRARKAMNAEIKH